MEKYFEINYTIEDIQGMSREEQFEYLEYLYDLRTEIMRQIDDKKSFYSEISYLIGEIEEKTAQDIMKEIQRALSSIQLNIRISLHHNDGFLATHIGEVWSKGCHTHDVTASRCDYDLSNHHYAMPDADTSATTALQIL